MADAGWYDDPQDPASLRWWDGSGWTDSTRPNVIPSDAPEPSARVSRVEEPDPPSDLSPPAPLPPWLANMEDELDDEDDDDEEYGGGGESGQSLFRTLQDADKLREGDDFDPDEGFGVPPVMERGPVGASQQGSFVGESSDGNESRRPLPPWLRESDSEPRRPTRESEEGRAAPPWLREDTERGNSQARRSPDREDRMPPWLRERQESGGSRSMSSYDDDDDDEFGERRQRPVVRGRDEPRVASWEEMADGYEDDIPDGTKARIRKIIFVGSAVLAGALLIYIIYSFFFGGESGTNEPQQPSIELTELGEWSQWPDAQGGYVVEFPNTPSFLRQPDKHVWTSSVETGLSEEEGTSEAQYQVVQKFADPNFINAASFDDRVALVENFLLEQYVGFNVESFESASVGGAPARQFTLSNGADTIRAVVVLTVDTLYVISVSGEGEFERFVDSFKWFREPEFPVAPG